jgi:dTDP-4-dehydrorhamnose 3,5-epimerase
MSLTFQETGIQGLTIIMPHQYNDDHFYLNKYFEKSSYLKQGLPTKFSEYSIIIYQKGTLRGLHFQNHPSQGKLIYVIAGSIFLIALDLRKNSKTFGNYKDFYFFANEHKAIYIPEMFANGVLSLEYNTIISYNCVGDYIPKNSSGIIWNDRILNIPWPIDNIIGVLNISEKDKKLQTFKEFTKKG